MRFFLILLFFFVGCGPTTSKQYSHKARPSTLPFYPIRPGDEIRPKANGPIKYLFAEAEVPLTISPSEVVINCYNAELTPFQELIYRECKRRFTNPVVVIIHGGLRDGEWIAVPDIDYDGPWLVTNMAWMYSRRYPDRDVVFWVCNPNGNIINVPRVWYFRNSAWVIPDSAVPYWNPKINRYEVHETLMDFTYCGNIWEAQTQNTWH